MMKKLSDFKDEKGIEIASEVLSVIMEMLADERNRKQEGEKNKSNRHKILYSNNLQDNNLNSQIYKEFSNIGVQADSVIALMGTFYNHKKK